MFDVFTCEYVLGLWFFVLGSSNGSTCSNTDHINRAAWFWTRVLGYISRYPGHRPHKLGPTRKKNNIDPHYLYYAVIFVVKQYDWGTELMFPKVSLEHPTSGFYLWHLCVYIYIYIHPCNLARLGTPGEFQSRKKGNGVDHAGIWEALLAWSRKESPAALVDCRWPGDHQGCRWQTSSRTPLVRSDSTCPKLFQHKVWQVPWQLFRTRCTCRVYAGDPCTQQDSIRTCSLLDALDYVFSVILANIFC